MKVIIWVGCIFLYSLCTVFLRYAGIILGGLPTMLLFGTTGLLATMLCRGWDKLTGKSNKEGETEK